MIVTLKDRLRVKSYQTYDTVDVEKKVVENYMVIQKYLVSDRISCIFHISDEDLSLKIPKNILQPLVENAIKHGLMTNKNTSRTAMLDGKIDVSVREQSGRIAIEVRDNGSGMTQEQITYYSKEPESVQLNGEHIGLMNLKGRLSYLYHGDYSFQIICPQEGGTSIRISIPLTNPK